MTADGWLAGVLVFLVATLLCVLAIAGYAAVVESRCLRAGWPHGQITWNLEPFCVKRINQTDVVTPLGELR